MTDTTKQPGWNLRVSYLCLEQSQVGSAAYAHLKGFFDEWPDGSLIVTRSTHHSGDSLGSKATSIMAAFGRYALTLARANTVGARAHPMVFPGILLGRLTGKRTFLFLQGRPSDLPSNSLGYRVLGWISAASFKGSIRCSDVVFATSEGLARWARSQSRATVIQVTNGVAVERFPWPVPHKSGVVFVGTPAPWQGLSTLLDAAASPNWPTNIAVTVIGVSADDRCGAAGANVKFLGRLTPPEVAEVLSCSAIGVSPKRLDQATRMGVSPFKLAEYHGAGLAVLASDVPGQREMVTASQGGTLFAPDSPEGIVAAVRGWHSDPEDLHAKQRNARSYAERELTWEAQRHRVIDALTVNGVSDSLAVDEPRQ